MRRISGGLLAASLLAATGLAEQPLRTVRITGGLSSPLGLTAPSNDPTRLYVIQRGGQIRIIRNGVLQPTQFLNISTLVSMSGIEQGLLGLAFHPDFASNRFFYVNYTRAGDGATMVVRYTALNPDIADPGSAVTVIGPIAQPEANHNGGNMMFGPDGKLYIATGDGGGSNDPHGAFGNAQYGLSLLGKILRLDVDIPFPHKPADNPFVGNPFFRDEIWAYGLRNPWRFSFDRLTGDMYIADVGQEAREEVSFQPASSAGGENYGWRCMEGSLCTGLTGGVNCVCFAPNVKMPIYEYSHGGGNCAITGGFVYRGCAIPDLRGTYFFADFCSNQIWTCRYDGTLKEFTNRTVELAPRGGSSLTFISSFGEDAAGELYIVVLGGEVFKIVPASDTGGIPYCTGKTNSLGCVPFLTTTGYASATDPDPFQLVGQDLILGQTGFYLYSTNGKADVSFHGGKLCMKLPFTRWLPAKSFVSNGKLPCNGELRRDFNNRIQGGADPLLTIGARVHAQLMGRDPADPAGFGDSLTDAVVFMICP
jgi:glucose/arabinose dehydrogenase